ncbi:protein TIFY 9 [Beta vulgaris subsp. vulgaris]|uniref:protein TIFY 9 n=1 Tax=Beta vulgaris subsp. vulgaris TaxID=3555 RepID=UPI0020374704|nr:protein TIFY 9 [Beta vulgaris subsp. vulgaris]
MAKSHVELDFFGLVPTPQPQPQSRLDRRQSFRGISKMNPEIVKSVLASASKYSTPENATLPGTPRVGVSQLPIFHPHPYSRQGSMEKEAGDTPPMTIFYNGTVSVFDLPQDKVEYIIKYAMEKNNISGNDGQIVDDSCFNSETTDSMNIFGPLNDGDMPIKRKKSLQRFFEKRKERLISVSPYTSMDHVASFLHLQRT